VVGPLLISLLLAQATCAGESATYSRLAADRARAFDLAGASDAWVAAAARGCAEADVAAHFVKGLIAAREAYKSGGSPESLEPVKQAIAALEARGAKGPGIGEVARFILLAASAAAQSERDEMTLLLEHAIQLETIQFEAGQGGAPGVTAHEVAGDLLLQVHRYDEARRYYQRAVDRLGITPRIHVGLARAALRLNDRSAACEAYRGLLTWWGQRTDPPVEVQEAREITSRVCL
jgi:tetratricopeptide (TPR) repeat protein